MKIHRLLVIGCFSLCVWGAVQAQSWLPRVMNPKVGVRLLGCKYDGARLLDCEELNGESSLWKTDVEIDSNTGDMSVVFEANQAMRNVGVAVAFDEYDWCSDNYVMIPASVYNGNRQRIVNREYATGLDKTDYFRKDLALTSNPIPQLSPDFGAPSRLEVNVSNTTTPVITFFNRKSGWGTFLFTDQGIEWNGEIKDHALIVEESADRSIASFIISAPGVREYKPEFIGFSPSPDRGVDVKPGDKITVRVSRIDFKTDCIAGFLSRFMNERKKHTVEKAPRNLMPMSEVGERMHRNIDERYYANEKWAFYCPENANWMSYGWIGGLMNTYPMIALGDEQHLDKVKHTFDFALSQGYGKSGFFYDLIDENGQPIKRDASENFPGVGLTRKNADVLYWMIKQFMLLKAQGNAKLIAPGWEQTVRRLADAFANTWKQEKTWGNYVEVESGKVAVFNTTSGAMAVGGMALAASYFNVPEYLNIARQAAADYYAQFALRGFTSGGCGDILQNADSETAAALMTSLMTLYETTGDKGYLMQSKDLANLCATWTVSFPYQLPDDTPLAQLGANLTGAVWASTQNKHGAPGFCTQSGDALFKIYRATGDSLYADLLRDIIHAHAEGVQPNGKITERLTYCDADSRGSRGDGGKTGWNETNGALMALEIPGIYLRTDIQRLYVFDHVEAKIVKQDSKSIILEITNPTQYDALVTVMSEGKAEADRPLGENGFLQWKDKVKVKAGKTVRHKVLI